MLVRRSILRYKTQRILKQRIEKFGEFHPATFAAYGRAFVAWDGYITVPDHSSQPNWIDLIAAKNVAQARAEGGGNAGWHNRHRRRRHRAAK